MKSGSYHFHHQYLSISRNSVFALNIAVNDFCQMYHNVLRAKIFLLEAVEEIEIINRLSFPDTIT